MKPAERGSQPEQAVVALLAEVTAHFAAGTSSEDVIAGIAGTLTRAFRPGECNIWVRTPDGSAFMPITGPGFPAPPSPVAASVATWVHEADSCVLVDGCWRLRIPLMHQGERLGLLEARIPDGPMAATFRRVVEIVVNPLAPMLASAELSEDLASEVALRTLETDAQRRFTARIIDSLPVGLYVIDRQYRIQAWNRQRETDTKGVGREEVIGRTVFDVLHRQPRSLLKREFDRVFNTGHMEVIEVESSAADQPRHYRITKIPMRLDGADVTHVITIGEDITEWKAVQQQIAQTERLAAVGQLAAGVMHEINNPLATIGACVEALSYRGGTSPGDWEQTDEYLRIIESELARCKSIVDGLLDFSRPKARITRPADVNQIVEDALFLIKHHDKFKRIKLVRELEPGLPSITANVEQLIQVFLALMLNAIDAMEGKGVMSVRTRLNRERSDEVVIEFEDTGIGIAREDIPKIFEPFFTSKQPGRGTGLGLSICYGIVQQHRGRILVDSQVGWGARFQVFLPVVSSSSSD